MRDFTLVPPSLPAEDVCVARGVQGRNGHTRHEHKEMDVNMNLPELAPFAWLMEDNTVRPFGADENAPFGDTFAHEALRDLGANRASAVGSGSVNHPHAVLGRRGFGASRLRVRWSHWKADRVAVRGEWQAKPSMS
jgi:hypothetical protein